MVKICLATLLMILLPVYAEAKPRDPHFELTQPVRYRVTHRTEVDVPSGLEQLRVYQAYPQPGIWSKKKHQVSVTSLTPRYGVVEDDVDSDGKVFRWTVKHLTSGKRIFESRFSILSVDRRFKPESTKTTWETLSERTVRSDPNAKSEVSQLARQLRQDSPWDTLREFSHWIFRNNRYEGSSSHGLQAAAMTIQQGQGHCGHHAFLYRALCRELGITCRIVGGYRLAKSSKMWSGRNDWNRHYWVEIWVPSVGWVEVEPRTSGDPFFLPSTLIRNPSFQSQVIWATQNGEDRVLKDYVDKTWIK